ncbi:MAG: DUF488 domain-containing protein [Acidimicrobiia bacterium]
MCGGREITEPTLFTIGHGTLDFDEFLRIVASHSIRTVIDVRSKPYSSRVPEYSRQTLAEELATAGISYRWLGDHLGGLPVREGEEAPISSPELLEAGVTEASALAQGATTVLLCSEAEPTRCHRLSVLAPRFEAAGFAVTHIRADGSLLPHQPSLDL